MNREQITPLLGTMPDAELARRSGLSKQYVSQLRNQAGIPRHAGRSYTDDQARRIRMLLGRVPDTTVAEALGVPRRVVAEVADIADAPAYERPQGTAATVRIRNVGAMPLRPGETVSDYLRAAAEREKRAREGGE